MVIDIIVQSQRITCGETYTVEKSQNYLVCNFKFSGDWDGTEKTVYFRNKKTNAKGSVLLSDDMCFVPSSVVADTGYIEISVWGVKGNTRITTGICEFFNTKTFKNDSVSPEQEKTLYEQILLKLQGKVGYAESRNGYLYLYSDSKKTYQIGTAIKLDFAEQWTETEIRQLITGYGYATESDVVLALSALDNRKVDRVAGKGLSTNDYTNADKQKVRNIPDSPKYTDTIYNDTELRQRISNLENVVLSLLN